MNQEQLFEAVDERRADQIFFADVAYRYPSGEVIRKERQDHGECVRKVWHDKIRQECVGLSAGALHARDFQTEHFRLPIKEGDKVTFVASPGAAGSFSAAVRADLKKQRAVLQTLSEEASDRKDRIF